jgi:hypothetical protein
MGAPGVEPGSHVHYQSREVVVQSCSLIREPLGQRKKNCLLGCRSMVEHLLAQPMRGLGSPPQNRKEKKGKMQGGREGRKEA